MIILSLFCFFVLSSCDNTDISNDNTQQTTDETNGNDNTSTDSDVCQHVFGEWNVVQNASCNEEGRRVRTCNTCSFAEEEQIPKSEIHTPITDAAVAPSCKNTGLTEGSHCGVCNKIIVKQSELPKEPHNYIGGYCDFCKAKKVSEGLKYENYERVGSGSFTGCTVLTDIYYEGTKEEWKNLRYSETFDTVENITITCSDGVYEKNDNT